ncbi:hypothetical protein SS50377_20235 [Spironucleus salmonicida]|uniref:Uncharacterized protein n=1 Tax=Spironucleus salmonicida TaxID=348837 RepID=V6LNJ2_9EUKA|nr:hypothetical protein SS50377_20235 [Spironucleus salmonicida]|eukprot:EST45291.1 hypothetical protein SS50377_14868 [Spironucleus salmonicida]
MRLLIVLQDESQTVEYSYDATLQSHLEDIPDQFRYHPFFISYNSCQQLQPRVQFQDNAFHFIFNMQSVNSCNYISKIVNQIDSDLANLPHQIDFYQLTVLTNSLFTFEQQGQQLTLLINVQLIDNFSIDEHLLIQSFLSTLNSKNNLFLVSKEQLNFAQTQLANGKQIQLQLTPNFCDGEPETLKQLFPNMYQTLRTLLTNTFLPIQSTEVPIHKNKTLYCPPIARIIDATNNLSDIFELGQSPTSSCSRLNGSFLGIIIDSINYLIKDEQNSLPQVFKQLLQNCQIQISLDDSQPENVTSAQEHIIQDFLQQRIDFTTGGGDSGAFLDAPGNVIPIAHFLLAEQSPDHREFIMTVQEVWIRLCLKGAPPSSVLQVQEYYNDCPSVLVDNTMLILQISSVTSSRDDFLGQTGDQYQLQQNDLVDAIDSNQTDTYFYCPKRSIFKNYQDPSFNSCLDHSDISINSDISLPTSTIGQYQGKKVYKIPYHLIHASEIFEFLGFNVSPGERTNFCQNNFLDFLFGSTISSILLSFSLYFKSIYSYILSTDLAYSSSKLKLLSRDPNFERYKVSNLFYEQNSNTQSFQQYKEFSVDILNYLLSTNKVNIDMVNKSISQIDYSNTYGRAMIRKYKFSNQDIQNKLNIIQDTFYQKYSSNLKQSSSQQNDLLKQIAEKNDIFENQYKYQSFDQQSQPYQDNQADFFKIFYNINIKNIHDNNYFKQEIDDQIIIAPRLESDKNNFYVQFMEVGLQQQKVNTLFPQQITINGISILNKQLNRKECNLILDIGFVPISFRFELYLYYIQVYPIIISQLRDKLTEFLMADYQFERQNLPFEENKLFHNYLHNKNFRKSSYFLIPFIWTQLNFKKIILTKKLDNKDIVMISRDQQSNSLILVLRIISYDNQLQSFELPKFTNIFDSLIQDFISPSLKQEFDNIFNNQYENIKQNINFKFENVQHIFDMLVQKLSLDKYMKLLNVGRCFQKYLSPIISSETIIKIPRHYALLKNNYLQSSYKFIQELLQCTLSNMNVNSAVKKHLHRFLNTCSVLSVGFNSKTQVYASSSKSSGEVTQQGKLSICLDLTSPIYHVKQYQMVEPEKVKDKDSAIQRLQYFNPSIKLQDEIQLFSQIQKSKGFYTFAIDDNFYFGLLQVPQDIFLSEFSSEIFNRSQYAANAQCFISDYDLFLHNIYLIIEMNEKNVKLYSATSKQQYIQTELIEILTLIQNEKNLQNITLHALRLALKDISCIFHHNLRCYAHLQSFVYLSFTEQAKSLEFIYCLLKKVQNLPITLSKLFNNKFGSSLTNNSLFSSTNILLIGPGEEQQLPEAIQPLIKMMQYLSENQIPFEDYQNNSVDIFTPVTFISLRKFTMVTDLESEQANKLKYEQMYEQLVDQITQNEFTESGSSISIAEPSFYGTMMVISTNINHWNTCLKIRDQESIEKSAPQWIDHVIEKFIQSMK